MPNPQLVEYIKKARENNVDDSVILAELRNVGWNDADISEAFHALNDITIPPVSVSLPASAVVASSTNIRLRPAWPLFKKIFHLYKSYFITVSIFLVIMLIGTSGVFVFLYYFAPPEWIIGDMMTNMSKLSSVRYSGSLVFSIDVPKSTSTQAFNTGTEIPDKLTAGVDFGGIYNIADLNNKMSSSSIAFKSNAIGDTQLVLNSITVNKVSYIKLNTPPDFTFGFLDLGSISDQWIKIDYEEIKSQFGGSSSTSPVTASSTNDQQLTTEQQGKIRQAFARAKLIQFEDKIGSEVIDGAATYHYKFGINKEGLRKFVKEVADISATSSLSRNQGNASIDTLFASVTSSLSGDIWIGKWDKYLRRVSIDIHLDRIRDQDLNGHLMLILAMKDFNHPIIVQPPEQSKSFKDVMADVYNPIALLEVQLEARDAQRISDLASLKSAITLYLDTAKAPVSNCIKGKIYSSNKGTTKVDGTGWLPINFTKAVDSSPIAILPIDPANKGYYIYSFTCNPAERTFELNTVLESAKRFPLMMSDTGDDPTEYEVGTNLSLMKINPNAAAFNLKFEKNKLKARNLIWDTGDYVGAEKYARVALSFAKTDREKSDAHYWIGLSYYRRNDFATAEGEYRESIKLYSKNANAYGSLAAVYNAYGKYDEAIDYAQKAIAIDSNTAHAHNNLGMAYYYSNQLDKSISEYKIAISLNPNDPSYHDYLGSAYFKLKLFDKSMAEYKIAISLGPKQAGFHYNLGLAYMTKDPYDKKNQDMAIDEYNKTIDLDLKFEDAYVNLIDVLTRWRGKIDQALEIADRGVSNLPSSPRMRLAKANIYNNAGRFDQYQKELVDIVNRWPSYVDGQLTLLASYSYNMNQFDDLKKALQQYIAATRKTKQNIISEINNASWIPTNNKQIILNALNEI